MQLVLFLSGAVTFGFAVAALFLLSFYRRTRDTLFLHFAIAFALLGLAQALIALTRTAFDEQGWPYLIRLAAFVIILFAIARKNGWLR